MLGPGLVLPTSSRCVDQVESPALEATDTSLDALNYRFSSNYTLSNTFLN